VACGIFLLLSQLLSDPGLSAQVLWKVSATNTVLFYKVDVKGKWKVRCPMYSAKTWLNLSIPGSQEFFGKYHKLQIMGIPSLGLILQSLRINGPNRSSTSAWILLVLKNSVPSELAHSVYEEFNKNTFTFQTEIRMDYFSDSSYSPSSNVRLAFFRNNIVHCWIISSLLPIKLFTAYHFYMTHCC
jgi:hypothetical protein